MSTSPHDDLEYFEDLSELIIDHGGSAAQVVSGRASSLTSEPILPESKTDGQPSGRTVKARRNGLASSTQKRSRSSSESDVRDFPSETAEKQQKHEVTVIVEATSTPNAECSAAVERPPARSWSRSAGSRAAQQSATCRESPLPRLLLIVGAMLIVAGLSWYLAGLSGAASSLVTEGTLRFEGIAPPVTCIKLLKLNSPIEEEYVSEIQNGRFALCGVPSGDYAIWFEKADGTPIPVRPVGRSSGLLKEAEHHLQFSFSSNTTPLHLELAVRKAFGQK